MWRWFAPMGVLLGGCCTEMGCSGTLTIFLDRALATDVLVTVDGGGEPMSCGGEDPGICSITEVDGRPAITVPTAAGDFPEQYLVSIAEDGMAAVEHEVVPIWSEDTFYPNGRRCGGGCTSGEAELTLDPP